MLYDLFADFYEKSSDRHPKYIVLMGTYNENTFDEMKILGFQEDSIQMPVIRTMLWMMLMKISFKDTLKTVIKAKCLMSYTRM